MTENDELIEFDEAIGRVHGYDEQTGRARIVLEQGQLRLGDLIRIMGDGDEGTDVLTVQDILMADGPDAAGGAVIELPVPRPVQTQDDVFLVRGTMPAYDSLADRLVLARTAVADPEST